MNLIDEAGTLRGFSIRGRGLRADNQTSQRSFLSTKPFDEGLIRWKFDGGRKLDVGILLRSSDGLSANSDGIFLRFQKDAITLVKRSGEQDILLVDEPIRLASRKRLEVILLVQDGTLLVEVFDPRKRAFLRALKARNLPPIKSVGLIAGKDHDPKLTIRSLTHRPACLQRWPKSKPGRARYLSVGHDVASRAIELLGSKRFRKKEIISEKITVYRTDLEGLAKLRCSGLNIGEVAIETPWKYMDPTYLRSKGKKPITTRRGFRIDKSYKNSTMNRELLKAYAQRFPDVARYVEIGRSHQGKVIPGLVITSPNNKGRPKPSIFINGAHHGNEPMSVEFVYDTIQRLLEHQNVPRIKSWLKTFELWVFPIINPDGVDAFLEQTWRTGRKNGRDLDGDGHRQRLEGVDLNRNYPFQWGALGEKGSKSDKRSPWYRGEKPGTEPEVQAVMNLANQERFAAALTFHTGTVKLLVPYTIPGVDNPRPHVAWNVASKLIEGLEDHPQDKEWVVAKNLYPVDGTDQDWHYHTNGTLALLIEGARRNPRSAQERQAVLHNVRPITSRLLDRIRRGPTVHGRVVDAKGQPVEAEVRVAGVRLRANERWLTRCHDGHFTRVLGHGGPTHLLINIDGYPPIKKKVRPRRGLTWVEIQLDFEVDSKPCKMVVEPKR